MNCLQAEELFSAHFEDTLDYQTLQGFEAHLTECEACQYDYARFQESVKAIQQLPQIEPSPNFMPTLLQRLAEEQRDKEIAGGGWRQLLNLFRHPRWALSGIMALILAAAGIYFHQEGLLFHREPQPTAVAPSSQDRQVATPSVELIQGPLPTVRDSIQNLPNRAILTSGQPMQQHYLLKQVSYTTVSTRGGL